MLLRMRHSMRRGPLQCYCSIFSVFQGERLPPPHACLHAPDAPLPLGPRRHTASRSIMRVYRCPYGRAAMSPPPLAVFFFFFFFFRHAIGAYASAAFMGVAVTTFRAFYVALRVEMPYCPSSSDVLCRGECCVAASGFRIMLRFRCRYPSTRSRPVPSAPPAAQVAMSCHAASSFTSAVHGSAFVVMAKEAHGDARVGE